MPVFKTGAFNRSAISPLASVLANNLEFSTKKLHNKLVKASEVANLAITYCNKFTSRKYNGTQHNKISSKDSSRLHTAHMAFALDTLMKITTGVELEHDTLYLQKRKWDMKFGIDETIGFNPNCILERSK